MSFHVAKSGTMRNFSDEKKRLVTKRDRPSISMVNEEGHTMGEMIDFASGCEGKTGFII